MVKKKSVPEWLWMSLVVVGVLFFVVMFTDNSVSFGVKNFVSNIGEESLSGNVVWSGTQQQKNQIIALSCSGVGGSEFGFDRCVNPDTGKEYTFGSNIWCFDLYDYEPHDNSAVHLGGLQVKYLRNHDWNSLFGESCVYTQRCDGVVTYDLPDSLMVDYAPVVVSKVNVSDPDSVFNVSNSRYVDFLVVPMCFINERVGDYITVPSAYGDEGYIYPVDYLKSHGKSCNSNKRVYFINSGVDLYNVDLVGGNIVWSSVDERYKMCW